MAAATLHALALPRHRQKLQPSQGYLRPLVRPFDRIVAEVTVESGGSGDLGNGLPEGDARAEALAVRLRRAGEELAWGEPLAPGSTTAAERLAFRRGRSSVEIARADPSLVSELQIGSWFNAGWRGRLLRRLFVCTPRLAVLARLFVPHPAALKLSLDVWFWNGVHSRATKPEWKRLTQSSYVALCYHQVSTERLNLERENYVPLRRFLRQLRILKALGYTALSSEEVKTFHLDPHAVLGPRRYLLTADDGYLEAVDSLERCAETRPVLFVVTGFAAEAKIGNYEPEFADWPRVRAANETGVAVGAHSRRHRSLVDCDDGALAEELAGARADFESAGFAPPTIVAYPYGRHDHRVLEAASAAGFALAYTTRTGLNGAGTDTLCLRRIWIGPDDGIIVFIWKLLTGEVVPTFAEQLHRRLIGHRDGHTRPTG